LLMNADGDLETIQQVVADLQGKHVPLSKQVQNVIGSHCSSIVKVTDDLSELYAGHTTWSDFWSMNRMFKQYTLRYSTQGNNAHTTLFSSYPAYLSSVDDYYQLSSKLVVMETTNGCFNTTLRMKYVVPTSVLSWMRVILANRMAKDGKDWINIFTLYNSGTYNNQWIIVDYNKFVPYQPLGQGVLYIAEQIPGNVISTDATEYLRLGYWPSFNIPFFKSVYDICMFPSIVEQYGTWFTYSLSPRGEIFRRDANKIKNLIDTRNLLRYNDWEHDSLSQGNPGNQISSRFDLVPKNYHPTNPYLARNAFGGLDSKATSYNFLGKGWVYAQSGPTRGGAKNDLPAFNWKDWSNISHVGQPDVWDFPFVVMPTGAIVE